MSKVLSTIAPTLDVIEFLIKNPDDWFKVRDIATLVKIDINRAYKYTEILYQNGFIIRERRIGFGRSIWVRLDKSANQTEIIIGLYLALKPKV